MFKTKYLLILLPIVGFILAIRSLNSNTVYDDRACELKSMSVKGRITKVIQSHELLFYIDTIKKGFPFHFEFDKDSYREIKEISKGEIYPLAIVGDSIQKKAGSKFVKFKRDNKIFIEIIKVNSCD